MPNETFYALYERLIRRELADGGEAPPMPEDFDPHHLDCLLNPQRYAPVISVGRCACGGDGRAECEGHCLFDAITHDEDGRPVVNRELCTGCGACVEGCKAHALIESRELLPLLAMMKQNERPVYVLIAPAFTAQFSPEVTPGRLRSAFKRLGFAGMVEVALFADILTLKEAMEFERTVRTEEDFLLTSCCCPIWIAMIRRVYARLVPHIPAAVSPMVACGRTVKHLHPEAVTVFVGPCMAKKAEAREPDIADAVDFVLTFQEVRELFDFAGIDPAALPEDLRDHSSRAGRIYARTGGVSEAVQMTVDRLYPERSVKVRARQADGIPACKKMLADLMAGRADGNFIEGMGCVGGCVGGPKALIGREEGARHVGQYGDQAAYPTPIDNPYVLELLRRLGIETKGSLLDQSEIFTRKF